MLGLCCLFPANKARKWPFFNLWLNCIILGSVDILFYILLYQVPSYWGYEMGTCLSHLLVISFFPKKLAFIWGGMLTLISHFMPWFVNTLRHSKLQGDSAIRIWLLAAALCSTTQCCKRSGRKTPRTLTYSVSCCGLVQNNTTLKQPHISPPFCEAICMSGLSCFMGSLVMEGKRHSPQHRYLNCTSVYMNKVLGEAEESSCDINEVSHCWSAQGSKSAVEDLWTWCRVTSIVAEENCTIQVQENIMF